MHKVLIVDDEESVRYSFKKLLRAPAYEVLEACDGEQALIRLKAETPDLVILDIQMPGLSGLEVLQQIKSFAPRTPVLIITAYGSSDRVIAAMKHGAYEYIEKPFDIPRMQALIDEALEVGRLMRTEVLLTPPLAGAPSADHIVGKSRAIQEVYKMIGRVAASDVGILLVGESGTGKELVARAIYHHSRRAHQPFLAVNCAAIPETLLESELFGFEKGAFTGAAKRKIGKFQQADGGTLFLDEVGDMSLSTQAKLLRVLQEGTFERLGGDETIRCDVRIIAATNKNLETAITTKIFREDLYYRLKVITIPLPPLRARQEDLPDLIQYFVNKYAIELKSGPVSLAPETLQLLQAYNWPGNVRELENVLKRAILLCKSNVITPEVIAEDLRRAERPAATPSPGRLALFVSGDLEQYHGKLYETVMSELERELILAAMQKAGGNQVRAAQLLGISRVMLHDRIERYGIKSEVIVQKA
ncbi:sigma-54-dependent Fis family transcriptional regulator [candidate division KSB1 bacterium]|nr:sigma-54 dependent transcriptional regulator [bacterium]NUM68370.1 sigma-54-dependent Fis family transcriptional regulator [candidate division KSB1 bacterium]